MHIYGLNQSDIVCSISRRVGESDRFSCIGSGVFVIVNEIPFLITAKHVLENLKPAVGLIVTIKNKISYKLYFFRIFFHPILDFAFIPLSQDFLVQSVSNILYYNTNIFGNFFAHPMDIYAFYGYPYTKNKIYNNFIEPFQLICNSHNVSSAYQSFLISKNYFPTEFYTLINFDSSDLYNDEGQKIVSPKTESISGGAIFNNRNRRVITSKTDNNILFQRASDHIPINTPFSFSLDSIIISRVHKDYNIIIGIKYEIISGYIQEFFKTEDYFDITKDFDFQEIPINKRM